MVSTRAELLQIGTLRFPTPPLYSRSLAFRPLDNTTM